MGLRKLPVFIFLLIFSTFIPVSVFAEDKNTPGGMIPKLPKTQNDPVLSDGHVYPFWGPPCQRYTYSVVYRDKEGRKPEYMKIYFNGKMIDMDKESQSDDDYKKGVKYIYKYVPNKVSSNFYYFEASNGLGKTRASIIDSPDNGPVLFTSSFDKNEIAVIENPSTGSGQAGKKILEFPTGKEWVGGIAFSTDGKYLAAKTSYHVYLFDITKPDKPVWEFKYGEGMPIGDDVKGGIAISADGSKIFASIGNRVFMFDKKSNSPVWQSETESQSYNVAISKDGNFVAAATAGSESNINSNLLILWNIKSNKPLWQYHASGNFHDVSLSKDGSFIAGSTGCPDRRFYLFSKDSNNPLIRTEPLTRDSPVHRAKISADGTLAAVGSESDGGAVFLFNSEAKSPAWKFPIPQGSSVRALNFTPDGQFIGAAAFGGNAYIFDKDKNVPVVEWKVNASLGGVDIADDGSFLAAGGTDKKLYIFNKDTKSKTEIPFNEYLEEIDISGNGKYIAAGTGGSVYFFETYISQDRGKTFDCSSVIEPQPENQIRQNGNFGGVTPQKAIGIWDRMVNFIKSVFRVKSDQSVKQIKSSLEQPSGDAVCGNDYCEPDLGETKENCPKDCSAGD